MSGSASRLWEKGDRLDELVHRFTVGDDPACDRHLVHWDCLGSAAHARTLVRAEILNQTELQHLLAGLADIDALHAQGRFEIAPELEDCHTAIESFLVLRHGPSGAKIHTGRSRNDQIAVAMRLFMRRQALDWLDGLQRLLTTLLARAERDGQTPMPGYTHMQPAMPSSVAQWLHGLAESALEQVRAGVDLLDRLDACPLGTGAGFGVPLPLDRAYTAALLGFARVQRSPVDVQNSRGRLEKYFVRLGADILAVLDKFACDTLWFSMPEYRFFALPEGFATGSSIMPQKQNPDVLELLRARAARLRARVVELELITAKLPSGYHRDLQLTKEPALRAAADVAESLAVGERVVAGLRIDASRLRAAMRPELYAAHAATDLTRAGVPFREAYRRIAERLRGDGLNADEIARWQASAGDPREWIAELRADLEPLQRLIERTRERVRQAESSLLPARENYPENAEVR